MLHVANTMISEVYNIDCNEFMSTCKDKQFNLAIVDPPYGINMAMGHKGSAKRGDKNKFNHFAGGDNSIPDTEYFNELFRISNNQIIWGANYMLKYLNPTSCFVVWDKVQPEKFSMSMCEFAWTSFITPAKIYKQRTVNADNGKIHPTQKPIQLYKWLLKNYAKPGDTILDTHLGSQSSRIACYEGGFDFYGCELDPEYFDAGCKRFENYKLQLKLDFYAKQAI